MPPSIEFWWAALTLLVESADIGGWKLRLALSFWPVSVLFGVFPPSAPQLPRYTSSAMSTPKHLYHYTSTSGLMGIVDSNCLWATDVTHLNDTEEVEYGRSVALEVLEEMSGQFSASENDVINDVLSSIRTGPITAYVTCFCETGDLLSQWRAYGESGSGYALGFEFEYLKQIDRGELVQVVYDPGDQRSILKTTIEQHFSTFDPKSDNDSFFELKDKIISIIVSLKHPSFSEEKEWRIHDTISDWRPGWGPGTLGLKFRPGPHTLIPYVEIHLPTREGLFGQQIIGLSSIHYGPTANSDQVENSLQRFLWAKGYSGEKIPINGSDAPLRS